MPSSTPELQAEWQDDTTAEMFLMTEHHCKLLVPSYIWVVPDEPGMSAKMYRAMQYLTQEWDYGGGWYFENEYLKAVEKGDIDAHGRVVKKEPKAND